RRSSTPSSEMDSLRALLACPACGGDLSQGWTCLGCGETYDAQDGVPDLRLAGDRRTDIVRAFYEVAPFPGYRESDTLSSLRARAGRSEFARLLDLAIP